MVAGAQVSRAWVGCTRISDLMKSDKSAVPGPRDGLGIFAKRRDDDRKSSGGA